MQPPDHRDLDKPAAAASASDYWILGDGYSVILRKVGLNRIELIKALRQFYGLRVEMSYIQEMLNSLPRTVMEGISREEAECLQKLLEAAGATAEVRGRETHPL
jgi:ribosomal protein L7/L12